MGAIRIGTLHSGMYGAIWDGSSGWWESSWECGASYGSGRSGREGQMGVKEDSGGEVLSVGGGGGDR